MANDSHEPLLEIEGLKTHFDTDQGVARAVDGVSYSIDRGETLCVVGESGCGKSVTALSVLRLLPMPPARIAGGRITFRGELLLDATDARMREIRGNEISMIFQEPMTSLNPVFRTGDQVVEALRVHRGLDKKQARAEAIALFEKVGIPSPKQRIDEFPHQMSGGMKQRVMIAMALACGPALLIADEPTTALDVTIQAQILRLIRELQANEGLSVLLITHDLGVVAEMADRVVVMYAGRVVESAPVDALFSNPKHPYTIGLFESLPKVGHEQEKLTVIEGNVPNPLEAPEGCKFAPRCRHAEARCRDTEPTLELQGDPSVFSGEDEAKKIGHWAACLRISELPDVQLLGSTADDAGGV